MFQKIYTKTPSLPMLEYAVFGNSVFDSKFLQLIFKNQEPD